MATTPTLTLSIPGQTLSEYFHLDGTPTSTEESGAGAGTGTPLSVDSSHDGSTSDSPIKTVIQFISTNPKNWESKEASKDGLQTTPLGESLAIGPHYTQLMHEKTTPFADTEDFSITTSLISTNNTTRVAGLTDFKLQYDMLFQSINAKLEVSGQPLIEGMKAFSPLYIAAQIAGTLIAAAETDNNDVVLSLSELKRYLTLIDTTPETAEGSLDGTEPPIIDKTSEAYQTEKMIQAKQIIRIASEMTGSINLTLALVDAGEETNATDFFSEIPPYAHKEAHINALKIEAQNIANAQLKNSPNLIGTNDFELNQRGLRAFLAHITAEKGQTGARKFIAKFTKMLRVASLTLNADNKEAPELDVFLSEISKSKDLYIAANLLARAIELFDKLAFEADAKKDALKGATRKIVGPFQGSAVTKRGDTLKNLNQPDILNNLCGSSSTATIADLADLTKSTGVKLAHVMMLLHLNKGIMSIAAESGAGAGHAASAHTPPDTANRDDNHSLDTTPSGSGEPDPEAAAVNTRTSTPAPSSPTEATPPIGQPTPTSPPLPLATQEIIDNTGASHVDEKPQRERTSTGSFNSVSSGLGAPSTPPLTEPSADSDGTTLSTP